MEARGVLAAEVVEMVAGERALVGVVAEVVEV